MSRNEKDDDSCDERLWIIGRKDENKSSDIPLMLRGKALVNATGSWSDVIEKSAHGASQWVTKPRRGQYRVYDSDTRTQILHPLQPIPSQRTKGIFVFSTLHNHLVVGPTALDQSSRTDRSIDPEVARQLDDHIRKVIPHINTEASYVGDYVGIRPGTDCRDYQIHLSPRKRWIAVAGIRSTGLSASLGIGNYVVRLLRAVLEDPPRSDSNKIIQTTRMPTLEQLANDYITHGDGCCAINGRRYRVTHPLTKWGFESVMSRSQTE
jgi:glycerol-3-phosphate dehydrogenase